MADNHRHHHKNYPETDEAASQGYSRTGQSKRPFDTSGVNWATELEEDDPPYRNWWVVEEERDDE